ncbi:hypothetical protein HMPREF1544_00666 [Mucor circinelloides 1006PhL]|uniref:Tc1-like transposase DDE domain-containing protein n=1 Tax=Mucor circinelloides f. circinelloides (strain 1006PhL) TaxID=1220926 RepID=S2KAA8_MUCC1|nr:hypothetical protein HMPREF1544_00666 [Mucor circinelloides 1006PhL]
MNIDYLSNCVFVDESAFDINMRPSTARSAKGTPAIFTTPSTHAVSHTILGAISAMGVVNIEIGLHNLKPKRIRVDGSRKRKQPQPKKPASKGTATGHYMLFLQNTMNFMERMTWSEKGTRAQFWHVVKSKLKRERFLTTETLSTRIIVACNVLYSDLEGSARYSVKKLDVCLAKEPL